MLFRSPVKSVDGYDSFITFTDDYSRYGYIYPIKEKSEALDKFKIFKAEVENQHDKRIKIVRSDRGGEYYGRHTPYGQVPGISGLRYVYYFHISIGTAYFLCPNDSICSSLWLSHAYIRTTGVRIWIRVGE